LLDTARLVRAKHPGARFEIFGQVEWHGIARDIAAMTPEQWEQEGVRFKGTVPYDEVGPAVARGMVGWLPRSADEPNNLLAWPNKLVEYMAAGLPIVASDLPAQAAVIAESETGRIVAVHSPEAHAEAICALLADRGAWERFSSNGKAAARNLYAWDAEARKLHTVYRKLGGGQA
jgi:glycosyltransferase involved in cell wall biosynthesis